MKYSYFSALALGLGLAVYMEAVPAAAQEPKRLGTFDDWRAYVLTDKGTKICYVASEPSPAPKVAKGATPRTAHILVTHRPKEKSIGVVSVNTGFALKSGSDVSLDIGGIKFDLFVKGSTAWARDEATDKSIVTAFGKGRTMQIKGTPQRGADIVDAYSLRGFAKAYAEIGRECAIAGPARGKAAK